MVGLYFDQVTYEGCNRRFMLLRVQCKCIFSEFLLFLFCRLQFFSSFILFRKMPSAAQLRIGGLTVHMGPARRKLDICCACLIQYDRGHADRRSLCGMRYWRRAFTGFLMGFCFTCYDFRTTPMKTQKIGKILPKRW